MGVVTAAFAGEPSASGTGQHMRQLDDPNAFQNPGDWRGQSRPGYRCRPTPQSVEFYRYIMEKAGRGEEINAGESMIIRRMIENRTWPEAPVIQDSDRAAAKWADQQDESEDSSFLTDPVGWTRRKNADLIYEKLARSGRLDQDTPPHRGHREIPHILAWQDAGRAGKAPRRKMDVPIVRQHGL